MFSVMESILCVVVSLNCPGSLSQAAGRTPAAARKATAGGCRRRAEGRVPRRIREIGCQGKGRRDEGTGAAPAAGKPTVRHAF
jgi:hypothetical protein